MTGADRWVQTGPDGVELAAHLLNPNRQVPVVVVTTPHKGQTPYFDLAALARDTSVFAEVVVLRTGVASRAFTAALPPKTGVYGGGARVYPPTLAWVTRLDAAPLFLATSTDQAARRYRALVAALHAATRSPAGPLHTAPADAVGEYSPCDVVPAMVTRVAVADMDVDLFPGLSVEVAATDATDDPLLALDDAFCLHDVIAVRIVSTFPWRLAVASPGTSITRPAPPLSAAGDPWIEVGPAQPPPTSAAQSEGLAEPWRATTADWSKPGRPEPLPLPDLPHVPPAAHEPALAVDAARSVLIRERDDARSEITHLRRELKTVEADRVAAIARAGRLQQTLNEKTARLRELHKQARSTAPETGLPSGVTLFANPEDAFRFDVYLAWSTRLGAQEKPDYPLARYTLGPDFLPSLESLEGVDRAKIIEVVTEVLCGRAATMHTHAPRPYRSSAAPHSPQRFRESDGAIAFRVNVQNQTAAARRLHYWQLPDRTIELWFVASHDTHSV